MGPRRRRSSGFLLLVVICFSLAIVDINLINAELLTKSQYQVPYDCEQCGKKQDQSPLAYQSSEGVGNQSDDKDLEIIVTYTDSSGIIQLSSVKAKDLSSSWVWENRGSEYHEPMQRSQILDNSFQPIMRHENNAEHSTEDYHTGRSNLLSIDPIKLQRQKLRQQRRNHRAAELMKQDKNMDEQMELSAIERAEALDTTIKGKYSIWRRDFENPNSDATVKLMRDQIIMAKAYANIAKAKNETGLYNSLLNHSKKSLRVIGEANSDSELQLSVVDQAKAMGHILAAAKERLYNCLLLARKLRVMIQSTEDNVNSERKKSAFLIQLAAKTLPRPLHCFPQLLTANYYLQGYQKKDFYNKDKLEDPTLYHYAIFSDNVLAASVVVNSTISNANKPEKHVFHIVTDKLNLAAMKMWFLVNPPVNATVEVLNVEEFKWLNSSYCPVLKQLESARMKEYYFKVNNPQTISAGSDNLKYRNPKYLSMLNHLRFYLPEVYPKLEKILFLDDDIVVQKDLTPLWSVDMKGMVNGAIETCKESFHRFDKYLNFSNPKISENFDPNACGWAFGMNLFDLKEWRRRNITGIYHRWQEMNEDRTLWKLGSLPPGLITFYNLTYPMERSWHVLGLGYDPALNQTAIDNAAVVHYNGNYKPWLDLAIEKYKSYWSRYVMYDSPYLQVCKVSQ